MRADDERLDPPAPPGYVELLTALAADGQRLPCQAEPDAWVSTKPADQARAVEGCIECPHMLRCGQYAIRAGERQGVWGALTPADRQSVSIRESA